MALTRSRLILILLLAAALALPTLAEWAGEPFYIRLATRILVFALAAVSLDLILGFGGMVSFGHAAFVGIGGYVVGILFAHQADGSTLFGLPGTTNALVVWPLAMLVGGLAALPIGAISLRTTGVPFIMITLAFAQMLFYLMTGLKAYGGDDGIALWSRSTLPAGPNLADHTSFYYVTLALLLAALVLGWRLVNSRFGRVIRGAKDNERRMGALGFPVTRYKLAAFVLSGMLAGLAGALLANATLFIGPQYLHWSRSGDLIVMVVLGGMGTLIGPVLGAAALLLLEEFVPEVMDLAHAGLGEHWKIVLGPVLLLLVLFARKGLWGLLAGSRAS
ncbi:branched-chain amino acid ABC transporter permease [Azospirillum thermophilum]|uniref:Branched-chain amino acid ABC transporter permease n=1 Tax=Azospirillum thermophilum TaxID=2202148 RepID=A0A2S2CZD7_9PROT|nr:branched-chain amino acid ABC transporter permease [Azospirillum thermophilum]AWK89849.1 branched-chain amino acid ABC transporter permease [Azospirillum thermophilum]